MIYKIFFIFSVFCEQTPNIFDTSESPYSTDKQVKETKAVVIEPGNKIDIKPNPEDTGKLEIHNESDQSGHMPISGEPSEELDLESDELDTNIENGLDDIARDAELLSEKAKKLKVMNDT